MRFGPYLLDQAHGMSTDGTTLISVHLWRAGAGVLLTTARNGASDSQRDLRGTLARTGMSAARQALAATAVEAVDAPARLAVLVDGWTRAQCPYGDCRELLEPGDRCCSWCGRTPGRSASGQSAPAAHRGVLRLHVGSRR